MTWILYYGTGSIRHSARALRGILLRSPLGLFALPQDRPFGGMLLSIRLVQSCGRSPEEFHAGTASRWGALRRSRYRGSAVETVPETWKTTWKDIMRCRRCLGVMHVDQSPDDVGVVEPWRCETWRCLGCGAGIDFLPICTSRVKRPKAFPRESARLVSSNLQTAAAPVAPGPQHSEREVAEWEPM